MARRIRAAQVLEAMSGVDTEPETDMESEGSFYNESDSDDSDSEDNNINASDVDDDDSDSEDPLETVVPCLDEVEAEVME